MTTNPTHPVANGQSAGPGLLASLRQIDWLRIMPFLLLHLACVGVFFVAFSWWAVGLAVVLYAARMFFITAFYHRYFSHRAFKMSRGVQFVAALLGTTAVQRGPLWWAAHHRHHHNHSDQPPDAHSPRWQGFFWSHTGWFLTRENFRTRDAMIGDWRKYPELVWLNRFDWVPPVILAVAIFCGGYLFGRLFPTTGMTGWQAFFWGFVLSTVVLYHATYTINSLAHRFGSRRFATDDDSRNNFALALLTLGEGWHNNHHHYPASVRQGFYWWELDVTWYVLLAMEQVGLIRDLRPVPRRALMRNRVKTAEKEDAR